MAAWQCFYLQRMGNDGEGNPHPVYESVGHWGVWCKDIPFVLFGKVKDPAVRSWNDEHGDDEYIGSDGLWMESYEMTVEFGCKTLRSSTYEEETAYVNDVRTSVKSFLEYLRESGMMKMYSAHTRIGRQNVRLVSVSDDAVWKTETHTEIVNNQEVEVFDEFLIFKVTFKVNDPITEITKNGNGALVVAS